MSGAVLKLVWIEAAVFGALFFVLLLAGSDLLAPDCPVSTLLAAAMAAFVVRGGLGSFGWRWLAAAMSGTLALCLLHTMAQSGTPASPDGGMPDLNFFWPVVGFMTGVPLGLLTQGLAWVSMAGIHRSGYLDALDTQEPAAPTLPKDPR